MSLTLFHERSLLLEPLENEGFRKSGIYIKLSRVVGQCYGRVIKTHPTCRDVKPGDFIVYRKHAPIQLDRNREKLFVLFESQVIGALRTDDGQTWFET